MNDQTIEAIAEELASLLTGRVVGKIYQLTRASLTIDFRTTGDRHLFISVEPNQPRIYLITRRARELEKQSLAPSPFALVLRKHLSGAQLRAINKDAGDRILRFTFDARGETGIAYSRILVAQLTGRTANLFLLDDAGRVIDALRPARGAGQETGERYQPPPQLAAPGAPAEREQISRGSFSSLSEALDHHYRQLAAARSFETRAAAILSRTSKMIAKCRKLQRNLENDLTAHGNPDEHKRVGDLLLANIATAERRGSRVLLTDYYAEGEPTIEIEVDEHLTLPEAAAQRFARYTKARRAALETAARLDALRTELGPLETERAKLENIIAARDEAALAAFDDARGGAQTTGGAADRSAARHSSGTSSGRRTRGRTSESLPGVRRYRSSDGYEILVGRAARDNDQLTFRIARPHDLWLHAADYPGSHVVVRNPTRGGDVPQRTVIEAAQLAAHFSQARADAKVVIHYTTRKFLSKPKGAAPGLVRMSSFRSLLVEPRESIERI